MNMANYALRLIKRVLTDCELNSLGKESGSSRGQAGVNTCLKRVLKRYVTMISLRYA
ncbi:hypothetical protein HanPI659440_Chr13g0506001 [Helianthus annuus]|nr:hypothetical protein HanPI659440_Chr13g0506001 [Helianthus annuus]